MSSLVYWAITAAVLLICAGLIGRRAKYIGADGTEKDGLWLGILIDDRQRYSLTHLQTVLWTLVFLSLFVAIFLARLLGGVSPGEALNMAVPGQILTLVGISGGSAVVATVIKTPRTAQIRQKSNPSQFSQMFMVEEGDAADKVIDVTRFQNFFLTWLAVGAYVAMAATVLAHTAVPAGFPSLSQDLVWLIGISHAAYIGGKLPQKS
jgi:hypothetical protein